MGVAQWIPFFNTVEPYSWLYKNILIIWALRWLWTCMHVTSYFITPCRPHWTKDEKLRFPEITNNWNIPFILVCTGPFLASNTKYITVHIYYATTWLPIQSTNLYVFLSVVKLDTLVVFAYRNVGICACLCIILALNPLKSCQHKYSRTCHIPSCKIPYRLLTDGALVCVIYTRCC